MSCRDLKGKTDLALAYLSNRAIFSRRTFLPLAGKNLIARECNFHDIREIINLYPLPEEATFLFRRLLTRRPRLLARPDIRVLSFRASASRHKSAADRVVTATRFLRRGPRTLDSILGAEGPTTRRGSDER